jgi:hypothetical protein
MSITACDVRGGFSTSLSQYVGTGGEGAVSDFSLYTVTLINNRVSQENLQVEHADEETSTKKIALTDKHIWKHLLEHGSKYLSMGPKSHSRSEKHSREEGYDLRLTEGYPCFLKRSCNNGI